MPDSGSFNTYFDNGATSFPKPKQVAEEISRYLNNIGGPYGRSYYSRAIQVSKKVEETRSLLADLIGTKNSAHLIFTQNATHALNIVIKGLNLRGKEVAISPLEHNAVCRPLPTLCQNRHKPRGVRMLLAKALISPFGIFLASILRTSAGL